MEFYEYTGLGESKVQQIDAYTNFLGVLPPLTPDVVQYLARTYRWSSVFKQISTGKFVFLECPFWSEPPSTITINDWTDLSLISLETYDQFTQPYDNYAGTPYDEVTP
jgi:hypothetical protein